MRVMSGRRKIVAMMCCLGMGVGVQAQGSAKDVVNAMLVQEHEAAAHRDNYIYVSNERSERTGEHLWTERVVETPAGRVRFLLEEDGKPISPQRVMQERSRLANDAAHPEAFQKREAAEKDEEGHARQMLDLLPKAFILENLKEESGDWRVDFRPDPKFSPSGIEERVLHGMSGWMLIDERKMRLHHLEGRLPQDLSIDLGLLNMKAGSNFQTTKSAYDGQWRTVRAVSDIRGKAALLKSISRNQDVARTEFKRVQNDLTVAQAVEMVER
jgi:hypothetical protein